MEIRPEDLFVGTVACSLGLLGLLASLLQMEWCYRLRTVQRIERRFGRVGARIFFATVGTVLIALGIAIVLGYGLNRS